MHLIKSLLNIFIRKIEQSPTPPSPEISSAPSGEKELPVCTVYTQSLGPNFPVKVTDINSAGLTVTSHHELFQAGEYVVLKMVFRKMAVSMPGRVCLITPADSEVAHNYFIEFRKAEAAR
jgi:hypothetical protein